MYKTTNVLEGVRWRVRSRNINLGEDPFGHGLHVLPSLNTIVGRLAWCIGSDTIFPSEGGLGWGINSQFPFAARFQSRRSRPDPSISLSSRARVDFDGFKEDCSTIAAREKAHCANGGKLYIGGSIRYTNEELLNSNVIWNTIACFRCDVETDADNSGSEDLIAANCEAGELDEIANLEWDHAKLILRGETLTTAPICSRAFLGISRVWNAHRETREGSNGGRLGVCDPIFVFCRPLRAKAALWVIDPDSWTIRYGESP